MRRMLLIHRECRKTNTSCKVNLEKITEKYFKTIMSFCWPSTVQELYQEDKLFQKLKSIYLFQLNWDLTNNFHVLTYDELWHSRIFFLVLEFIVSWTEKNKEILNWFSNCITYDQGMNKNHHRPVTWNME